MEVLLVAIAGTILPQPPPPAAAQLPAPAPPPPFALQFPQVSTTTHEYASCSYHEAV